MPAERYAKESVLPVGLAFGTGLDGDVTITGTVTITRDMSYNNLTVNGTLNTAGFRVFVRGTLTGAGTITNSGVPGGASGSHPSTSNGYYWSGAAGGGSSVGAGLQPGSPGFSRQFGGDGGSGGAGSGGAGGLTATNAVTINSVGVGPTDLAKVDPFTLRAGFPINTNSTAPFQGGAGGGGGGGDGTNLGAGGGQGGGIVVIFAYDASAFTGAIRVDGGKGGDATGTNCGGGGGGGGGFAALYARTLPTGAYTMSAAGGTGGAKTGTGSVGSAGSAGTTVAAVIG